MATLLIAFLRPVFLGLMISAMILQSSVAAICFSDPKRAYDQLLRQQSLDLQAASSTLVNINTASEAQLVSLHGIGSSKAQAIILYREMFGRFDSADELAKVKGVGAKTIEKNRSRIQVR